ncbi:MAG TPA: hypothetical protein VF092_08705 [Longimicrobium sp.]
MRRDTIKRLARFGLAVLAAALLMQGHALLMLAQGLRMARYALPAVGRNPDLTRALDGGVGRRPSHPVSPGPALWTDLADALPGNDTLLGKVGSLCWLGDRLVVADRREQRLLFFAADGRLLNTLNGPAGSGTRFDALSIVRCAPGGGSLLVADREEGKVWVLAADGRVRSAASAPHTPQFDLYLGDFALAPDGRWYDSWLGSGHTAGPYLSPVEWSRERLVRAWDTAGRPAGAFGEPVPYASTVARRVLNRTYLALARDTVWVLTQGDATVRGFDRRGTPVGAPILLAVSYRGAEPRVRVDSPPRGNPGGWRGNWFTYQPNVAGLAVVGDSLFAGIRYRDWTMALVGPKGDRYVNYYPHSALEVFDRRGRVLRSLDVRGRAVAVASDGGERIAVLSQDRDGTTHVLVAPSGTAYPSAASRCSAACAPGASK